LKAGIGGFHPPRKQLAGKACNGLPYIFGVIFGTSLKIPFKVVFEEALSVSEQICCFEGANDVRKSPAG